MELPQGHDWLLSENSGRYIKLYKALYGLKQAPREWYTDIDAYLRSQGFVRSENNTNLYTRNGYILVLYVDDVLITGPHQSGIDEVKKLLHDHYKMSDLGLAKQFLGMQIEQLNNGIKIHQSRYIATMLERFGMANAHATTTPLPPSPALSAKNDDDDLLDSAEKSVYMSIVGSLMYAMVCTRPDLAFTMSRLSKFMANPKAHHMTAARHALRYLRGTSNAYIHYNRATSTQAIVEGFSDSDFASDVDTRRSTSGYAFLYNDSAISWRSKQQDMVTLSTMEAEYVGMTEAAREMIWLQRLLQDLHSGDNTYTFLTLYGDNQSAIAFTENARHHTRNKHIGLRYHFIRELVTPSSPESTPLIQLQYKPTADMTADILTKSLSRDLHQRHSLALGMGLTQGEQSLP